MWGYCAKCNTDYNSARSFPFSSSLLEANKLLEKQSPDDGRQPLMSGDASDAAAAAAATERPAQTLHLASQTNQSPSSLKRVQLMMMMTKRVSFNELSFHIFFFSPIQNFHTNKALSITQMGWSIHVVVYWPFTY